MSRVSPSLVGDASSPAAISSLTITYTTDDPGITANGAVTIADGDGTLVTAEVIEWLEELTSQTNAILAALRSSGIIQT